MVATSPDQDSTANDPTLRERVAAGEATVGTFVNMGSAVSAEICAQAGNDWVLIDLEHGSGSAADLLPQLQAVTGTGATPLVRVETTARINVSRALDAGAGGIMFPRIESLAESRRAVEFLRFPPAGVRGVAGQNRGGRFGQVPLAQLGDTTSTIGIVQVETTGALDDLEAIAALDGVDVLFVGPGDLSFALGAPAQFRSPSYLEALDAVVAACAIGTCSPGILLSDVSDVEPHLERGFRFVGIGSDSAQVMAGASANVNDFRAAVERQTHQHD